MKEFKFNPGSFGEILCKGLTWSNDSREDNQHSGFRSRKKGIVGEVCAVNAVSCRMLEQACLGTSTHSRFWKGC